MVDVVFILYVDDLCFSFRIIDLVFEVVESMVNIVFGKVIVDENDFVVVR